MIRDEATERQIAAASPRYNTWVSANAGSGKTRVLTDRVARLLLLGVPPEKILCLTYTKAAAAEMQNRLFKRLGEWTMLPDDKLRSALADLGGTPPEAGEELREARRLFARAIEAPGGLKIQTIHSFASSLLRRFPLEAGVSPDFTEIDDRAQALLREDILNQMAEGPEAPLLQAIAQYAGEDLEALTAEIARYRDVFGQALEDRLGLPEDYDETALLREVFLGGEEVLLSRLVPVLAAGSKNDQQAANVLAQISGKPLTRDSLEILEGLFLTGKGAKEPFTAKVGKFPTKATQKAAGPLMGDLDALMQRVEAARPKRLTFQTHERTQVLNAFAGPFLRAYAEQKMLRGWLDFDDLILKAGALLSHSEVAQWVLFRLDGGIDHILVDEAQDTSPAQWNVIRLITQEFAAGEGARADIERTIFVVGDMKQSIYSFQGADPTNFDRMAQYFEERFAEVGQNLSRADLLHSFRTAPAILRVVDQVFAQEGQNRGLGGPPIHVAFHEEKPGRVDLWPIVPVAEKQDDPAWHDPVDRIDPEHHDSVLANEIAAWIFDMCFGKDPETLPVENGRRPLTPGDFLILVQGRSTLFAELIRACKAVGLPIAGADRLRLGGELAVKDLAALLAFLATPEDDLSLAAVLKSPLFGWDENRLFKLAYGRGEKYLWEVLRERSEAELDTVSVLQGLRKEADFLRPYELLERILIRHDGRRKLLARLGPEAEDGIDVLLAQAMAYERSGVPSLTGFLHWMQTEDVEVKRQLEQGGGVVRVMTVHGAKGLEEKVVILPDTRPPQQRDRNRILVSDDGVPWWKPGQTEVPPALEPVMDDRRRKAEEERMRLLYVAMTRAENWLVVAGAGEADKGQSWYNLVQTAMEHVGALPIDTPTGQGLRFDQGGAWQAGPVQAVAESTVAHYDLPEWARKKAIAPLRKSGALSPSDLGGAKALPGEAGVDEEAAKLRGRRLHILFQHLPDAPLETWQNLSQKLLSVGEDATTSEEANRLYAEAKAVITAPEIKDVFAPGALAEVEIAAPLPALNGQKILGTVDRLIIMPDRIRVVDFKTNAVVPTRPEDIPEGVLRQMAAYAEALGVIYPGRTIEAQVLWTTGPVLMPIPSALLTEALIRVSLS